LLVEDAAASVDRGVGGGVVVVAAANAEAEDEPAVGHMVEGGDLFGQQRGGA
jgi:hypothetical protein